MATMVTRGWRNPRGLRRYIIAGKPGAIRGSEQPEYGLAAIAEGRHDDFIREYAQNCVVFGKPIMLRIMHEFNGVYYPWSGYRNNNDPNLFIAAFRHIVDIFRRQNATNVTFMWSPNYYTTF